jgi:FdhE protein
MTGSVVSAQCVAVHHFLRRSRAGRCRLALWVCGANWYYPRLQCPFCRNHDHRTLGTISVEGEEVKYHVQTCDQFRGYLKVVVTFDPTPVDLLMVEDLATLHLDMIAVERQYARVL